MSEEEIQKNQEKFNHITEADIKYEAEKGLSEELIRKISAEKDEPEWMLKKRLQAYRHFEKRPMPDWGPDLSDLDFDEITPFMVADAEQADSWDEVPEEIKDTFDKLGIPEAEKEALSGVGAQYECLAGDSKVFTNPEGPVEIESIEPGSKVFSIDPESKEVERREIIAKKESGVKETFELKVKGGRKVTASNNHPFLVLDSKVKKGNERKTWFTEWRSLENLEEGDYIAVSKDLPGNGEVYSFDEPEVENPERCKDVEIPSKTSENLMWLLGFYLGDGFIKYEKTDKKRVSFAVDGSQKELRNEIIDVAEGLFDTEVSNTDSSRLSIFSTPVAQFFIDNGFKGQAGEKCLPDWLFKLPEEQKLAFLAGYLDADGNVRANDKNKDPVITSKNRQLLDQVRDLALYTGLNTSSIHEFSSDHPHKEDEKITAYRIQISGNTSRLPSRHPVKKERLGQKEYFHNFSTAEGSDISSHCSKNIGFARIENIEPEGEQKTYDIQVEGRSNFISNGIVAHNSEVVYQNMKEQWEEKGVIFCDMDKAVQEHEELVKDYFMNKCVPPQDNKFAALHGALWSGGSFVYVPEGVEVEIPVQAYFRMNSKGMGQFEHTLIIAEENSTVHYIEGCSAPQFTRNNLHSGCVEVFVGEDAHVQYSTVQNWSKNTYNLNTKRAKVQENGTMEWVSGSMGSKVTMLYPSSHLNGEGARANHISIAYAGEDQNIDTGAKVVHNAPNTKSTIESKSISQDNGRTNYRGLVRVSEGASGSKTSIECDALMFDEEATSDTEPYIELKEDDVEVAHEATVGKIGDEEIHYMMSRGIEEEDAKEMIVRGFIEPIAKELPLEYAVELNRLIQLEMEGSLG